jgi:hypothetical protein
MLTMEPAYANDFFRRCTKTITGRQLSAANLFIEAEGEGCRYRSQSVTRTAEYMGAAMYGS